MEMKNVLVLLSGELRSQVERGDKMLELSDVTLANLIESTGEYYVDRFSEKRNCYILMRRERR